MQEPDTHNTEGWPDRDASLQEFPENLSKVDIQLESRIIK